MSFPIVKNPENGRRTIRWVIAHFPLELFVRAAKAFEQELEKLVPGQFELEIHTPGSYFSKYSHLFTEEELELFRQTTPHIKGLENPYRTTKNKSVYALDSFNAIKPRWAKHFEALKAGKFEMTQTQINIVANHVYENLSAIDLPFLFRDHDHVSKVLDGEIGDRLCEEMSEATGVKGLGYTYSGGYRIVGSTEEIRSLDELSEKKFITFTSPSSKLFGMAGVNHIGRPAITATDIGDMNEEGGAIETTYLRFEGKNVLKTNHSIFMTQILTSNDFFDTLTPEQQEAFKIAAKNVAKIERIWSVEDAKKYEDEAKDRGVNIVEISEDDKLRLRKAAVGVYRQLHTMSIDPELVKEIMDLGKTK
jgi:TRAP-type C4-dicarboxylate transport system substrate-binding protein